MSEPYMGQISMFAFTFAPRQWALCDGQIMSIQQNNALYSLLKNNYGGDGKTTFGLPDFRGRVPIHQGKGNNLTAHNVGDKIGSETVVLDSNNSPKHNHYAAPKAVDAIGRSKSPLSAVFAKSADGQPQFIAPTPPPVTLKEVTTLSTGLSQGHNNMQPFLTIIFCICCYGLYPPRS